MTFAPEPGSTTRYRLNPRGVVGAIADPSLDLEVLIRPKLAVRRVLFLLAYSMHPKNWRNSGFDLATESELYEAVIPGFAYQADVALRKGLLQGYRSRVEALQTVKGRIRFED